MSSFSIPCNSFSLKEILLKKSNSNSYSNSLNFSWILQNLCFTIFKIRHNTYIYITLSSYRFFKIRENFEDSRFVIFFSERLLVTLNKVFEGMRNYAGCALYIICLHRPHEKNGVLQRTLVQAWRKCTGARSGKFPLRAAQSCRSIISLEVRATFCSLLTASSRIYISKENIYSTN